MKNLPKNVIRWFHIPTANFDRAVKFYSIILDNPINVMDFGGTIMGFFPMAGGPNSDGVGGALMPPKEEFGWKPSDQGTQVFLYCEGDLNSVLGRVVKAGGKILIPKAPIGDSMGFFAFFEDTEGNKVGLHSAK